MIRSCRDADTAEVLRGARSRKFRAIQKQAEIRLAALDSATSLMDLALPGYRLEKLKGDRKVQYSIRINDRYRICFEWTKDGAHDVEIIDYH